MKDKIALYMETTKKTPEQTIGDIQKLLKKLKIRDILTNYGADGEVKAFSFSVDRGNSRISYRLPVDHKPLWRLAQQGKTKYIRTESQARNVAWRQVYRWIMAQLAIIHTEVYSMEEVFLSHMMVNRHQTVYDKFLEGGFVKLLLNE